MMAPPDEPRRPLFAPEFWNALDRFNMELPTTTNNVEAWHTRFQACVARQHPSIFLLLQKMKYEQARTERVVVSLRAGGAAAPTRRIYKQRKRRLRHIVQTRVGRTTLEYLRGLAHNFTFAFRRQPVAQDE